MLILIQRSSIFVRTYRRYVLYKHKTSSYAYFFQRKKYIKKESFPFFLTKIGDFGVKMRRTFFDSKNLRYLYSYSEFRRNFTRMQEPANAAIRLLWAVTIQFFSKRSAFRFRRNQRKCPIFEYKSYLNLKNLMFHAFVIDNH